MLNNSLGTNNTPAQVQVCVHLDIILSQHFLSSIICFSQSLHGLRFAHRNQPLQGRKWT